MENCLSFFSDILCHSFIIIIMMSEGYLCKYTYEVWIWPYHVRLLFCACFVSLIHELEKFKIFRFTLVPLFSDGGAETPWELLKSIWLEVEKPETAHENITHQALKMSAQLDRRLGLGLILLNERKAKPVLSCVHQCTRPQCFMCLVLLIHNLRRNSSWIHMV